jgi:hypothetical protein
MGKEKENGGNDEKFVAEDEGWGNMWNREGVRQGRSFSLCG